MNPSRGVHQTSPVTERGQSCPPLAPFPRTVATLLSALALAASLVAAPPNRLDVPIVVTQLPQQAKTTHTPSFHPDLFRGARLILISPDGQTRLLSESLHSACDPNVSFDGQRLLFAGRQSPDSRWRIWEMGLDGHGLRPITPDRLDAHSPLHVSTLFTLDSPEPWLTTVFVAREPTLNEAGQPASSSLYNIKLDGTELRRLTFSPNHNLDPFQLWDGRVLYASEHLPIHPGSPPGSTRLHAVHIEGADMEFYGGDRGQRFQRMPCATDSGLVVFIESPKPTPDNSGQLACVDQSRPHVTYRPLTQDPAYAFLHPAPLDGSRLLVARRATRGKNTWGVFAFDANSGRCDPVFDTPGYHEVQAVVASPRTRPDGHSTVVDTQANAGIFYGLNGYDADARLAPHLPTGIVQRVRFIEGMLQPADGTHSTRDARTPFVPRRLVGEAPVEADGSFNVEVPADTPLLLQTLDARGLALETCGWIWVKPKEKRGCIGCHEDPERIPENQYVLALRRPSNNLLLPAADRRTITFRDHIAPILQLHCATADCHGGRKSPLHLPLSGSPVAEPQLQKAYATLMAPAGTRIRNPGAIADGKYVDPGRARTSWLIWQLTAQNTSRPWDSPSSITKPREINLMPPTGKSTPLSPEEIRTLIQWIDMGAPYSLPIHLPAP